MPVFGESRCGQLTCLPSWSPSEWAQQPSPPWLLRCFLRSPWPGETWRPGLLPLSIAMSLWGPPLPTRWALHRMGTDRKTTGLSASAHFSHTFMISDDVGTCHVFMLFKIKTGHSAGSVGLCLKLRICFLTFVGCHQPFFCEFPLLSNTVNARGMISKDPSSFTPHLCHRWPWRKKTVFWKMMPFQGQYKPLVKMPVPDTGLNVQRELLRW